MLNTPVAKALSVSTCGKSEPRLCWCTPMLSHGTLVLYEGAALAFVNVILYLTFHAIAIIMAPMFVGVAGVKSMESDGWGGLSRGRDCGASNRACALLASHAATCGLLIASKRKCGAPAAKTIRAGRDCDLPEAPNTLPTELPMSQNGQSHEELSNQQHSDGPECLGSHMQLPN